MCLRLLGLRLIKLVLGILMGQFFNRSVGLVLFVDGELLRVGEVDWDLLQLRSLLLMLRVHVLVVQVEVGRDRA